MALVAKLADGFDPIRRKSLERLQLRGAMTSITASCDSKTLSIEKFGDDGRGTLAQPSQTA